MHPTIWIAAMCAAALINGCQITHDSQSAESFMAVKAIYSDAICPSRATAPEGVWIETNQALESQWQRLHSHRLGGSIPPAPLLEMDSFGFLLIRMGQKSTGGYGLELAQTEARVDANSATVHVKWIRPSARAMVAQVITSPCLLLKIKRGPYQTIKIVDQSGLQRASVSLT
jgi:hypothetical protein